MTDEAVDTPLPSLEDTVKEMQTQYQALKDSFDQANKDKDAIIAELKKQNEELSRAVVRSAFAPPAPEPKEPTPEELYAQKINDLFEKSKKLKR